MMDIALVFRLTHALHMLSIITRTLYPSIASTLYKYDARTMLFFSLIYVVYSRTRSDLNSEANISFSLLTYELQGDPLVLDWLLFGSCCYYM